MIRCSRSWLTDKSIFNHIIEMRTVLYSLLFLLAFTLPGNAAGLGGAPPKDQTPPAVMPPVIIQVTQPTAPEPVTKSDIIASVMDYVICATISPKAGYGAPAYVVDFVDASFITGVTLRNQQTGVCYQGVWPYSDMARIYVPELTGEWLLTVTVIGGDSVSFVFVAI